MTLSNNCALLATTAFFILINWQECKEIVDMACVLMLEPQIACKLLDRHQGKKWALGFIAQQNMRKCSGQEKRLCGKVWTCLTGLLDMDAWYEPDCNHCFILTRFSIGKSACFVALSLWAYLCFPCRPAWRETFECIGAQAGKPQSWHYGPSGSVWAGPGVLIKIAAIFKKWLVIRCNWKENQNK